MENNILGMRLKALRTLRQLRIKDIAEAVGLSPMAYNHYEWGDREPSLDVLKKLCDFFDVPADYLIGRSDDC